MDARKLAKFRKLLTEEKARLTASSRSALKNEALNISADDLPDETDLAATEVNHHLQFRLRDRERRLLSKIEEALSRLDSGSFGTCEDCEENIELKRLEARPMSTLCLSCKETQEHKEKVYA
ncbi:MAG: TraR/DksA C4-type zinc finger protein [Bdellovibrionales bacterium]|nr:TraR/DksA C4-type zinc finger protein [Bdellovibrionales bacterium]